MSMINGGLIGGNILAGSGSTYEVGIVSVGIIENVISLNDRVSTALVVDVFGSGNISATVQIDVVDFAVYAISAVIEENIHSPPETISVSILENISQPPATPVGSHFWSAKVFLADVDISALLTGTISIDSEVNAARIATFTMKPTAGVIDPFSWVKRTVRIDYMRTTPAGGILEVYTLFNGVVDTPVYDTTSRLTSFNCTDLLQRKFEGLKKEDIAAIIPGYWSKHVFSDTTDNWTYANNLLSTIPYDMDADVSGSVVLTPWLAKETADWTFGMGSIVDESLSVDLANSRDLVNEYTVDFDYRYEQFRERSVRLSWTLKPGLLSAQGVIYQFNVPFGQTFNDAVSSAGLVFLSKPSFTPLPVSGTYLVFGFNGGAQNVIWVNENPDAVQAASGHCSLRYSQTITEKRSVVIKAPQSIAQLGSIPANMSASVSADYGDNLKDFSEIIEKEESHRNNARAVAVTGNGAVAYNVGGTVSTKYNVYKKDYEAYSSLSPGLAGEITYNFTSFMKEGDRAEADTANEVQYHIAETDILASHRRNSVRFTTPLAPHVDRPHTVRITTDTVTAKGKVRQVSHSLNIDEGTALTEITLAVSLASGIGIPDLPPVLVPPTEEELKPATDNGYNKSVILGTYIAGLSGDFDESWTGWISTSAVYAEGYSDQFVIKFDGVPDSNVQEQVIPFESALDVIIPIDELILEA